MDKAFDKLQLIRGNDLIINNHIIMHHPTLDEICSFGEQNYFRTVSFLTSTSSDLKVQLNDMGLDYEKITDYEIFLMFSQQLTVDNTYIFFGDDFDLSRFHIIENPQNNEAVLYDPINDCCIDRLLFTYISNCIRILHFIERKVDKPANVGTKKYLIDTERRRQERSARRPYESILIDLISSLVNCEQFKYDYTSVWELPIYTFNDSIRRIQKLKDYNNLMYGIYTGNVDVKKINQDKLNWLGNLKN